MRNLHQKLMLPFTFELLDGCEDTNNQSDDGGTTDNYAFGTMTDN